MLRFSLVPLVMGLVACNGTAPPTDDAGSSSCELDRACPESAPVFGGPCEGSLRCSFEACGPGGDDVYECSRGTWTLTEPGCIGGSLPLAESCRAPFAGTLSGSRLWLSADRAGAPELTDGDSIEIAFGAQGLAMAPFRVHVDASDPAIIPACIRVTTALSLDAEPSAPSAQSVRLRCGSSLRIQEILPSLPCEFREYAIGVDVSADGIGSLRLELRAMGGMCPRS